jgi:serine/threonine protein kinase
MRVPLQPGQLMKGGTYRVVRPLSKGGMGAIYLVEDLDAFGRQRVLKEMLDYVDPADYADQSAYQQAVQKAHARFEEEARTLAALSHRGIPDIIAYFSENNRNYIIMEYVEGADLEKRLTHEEQGQVVPGQPYPAADVIRYGVQLCRVLEYLAALPRPVVHQDIKPANLILDRAGDVRLVDFGTAKARMAVLPGGKVGLQKSSVYGTVGYAPPEQYQGKSEPRSDVYALAATMYHLLTDDDPRRHPFSFPRLPGLPQELWRALDGALQQDPGRRPTAAQFRAQLEALLAPQGRAEPIYLRNGAVAHNVDELVQVCDQGWADARYHLFRGDFEERLRKWGRTDLEARTAALRGQYANDQDAGLDAFLRLLDPTYPPPHLQLNPPALQVAALPWGRQATLDLEIRNAGHGCLQGCFVNLPCWVQIKPDRRSRTRLSSRWMRGPAARRGYR